MKKEITGMYTIKEIARLFDINASTLRYYEEIGLLTEVGRNENNQRVYDDSHIAKLNGINCFKRTGMSIAQIQKFYEYEKDLSCNIDNILELVTKHEKDIIEKIEAMKKDLEHINHKVRFYSAIKKAEESGEPYPKWEEV